MAKKKKDNQENNDTLSEEAGREFGIKLKQLETLMQTRGHDGIKELNEAYGGLSGLGQRLKSNLITGRTKDSETDEIRHCLPLARSIGR